MLPSSRRKKRLAIGVLLALSLLATLAVGGYSYQLHAQGEAAAFDLAVQQAKAKIESRFAAYAQVLRASAALFVVNDAVDREQWRAFVQHLDAQQQLPGIQGIGFAKYLTRSELGAHEAALKAEGRKVKVGKFMFMGNARAKAVHQGDGFVKLIVDAETDRVLGASIIGPAAGDMIHEICVAMEFGASAQDIALTCHAHPTYSEAVREAALACGDGAIHA